MTLSKDDEIMALNAEIGRLRELSPPMRWEPIETAPKVGVILLYGAPDNVRLGYEKMGTGYYIEIYERDTIRSPWNWVGHQLWREEPQPTHWMRLPEPPADQ